MRTIFLLAIALGIAWWLWGLRNATTLFTIRVRDGRVVRARGRVPARLLSEVAEIVERAGVTRADIRAVTRDGRPVLDFRGEVTQGTMQQMRNVVGQFTAHEIESGPRQ